MSKLKINFFYSIVYNFLTISIPLITAPYLSRVIYVKGIGEYSYTYSIAQYFVLFAMLGINNYGSRTIAKNRDSREKLSIIFCEIYCMQLIVASIVFFTYLFLIFNVSSNYKTLFFMQIFYVFSACLDINWFFAGIEQFKITVIRSSVIKIISTILIFLLIKEYDDLWKYSLITSLSTLISQIVLFVFIKKYVILKKIYLRNVLKHIFPNVKLFVPIIAVSIYNIMDKIMLGAMCDTLEVGFYENAEKIIQVPIVIISALSTVMLPRMSNLFANNKESKIKEYIRISIINVMFFIIPIILGLIAIAKDFSILFFGSEFAKTGYLIMLLSSVLFFKAWANVIRTQYLIPKEYDKIYILSVCLGAIVNLIINMLLIPQYGSVGACIGTIAAEIIVMLYQTYYVRKELDIKVYIDSTKSVFVKSLLMFCIMLGINFIKCSLIVKVVIQIMSGIIIYCFLNINYIEIILREILKGNEKKNN